MNSKMDEAYNALMNIVEMIQERNYVSMAQFFEHIFAFYREKLKKAILPENIEISYTGLHLGSTYEENDFIQMINSFSNNQALHAKYALQIMRDAVAQLKTIENVRNCDLNNINANVNGIIVVGDLHGHFNDLFYLIKKFGIPGKDYCFVFNGDFVDRGPQQSEVLLTLLYAFLMYPTRVFLNRGNHEDKSLNLSAQFDPNFKTDVDLKFGNYGLAVFNEAIRVFRYLPLATIITNKGGYKWFVIHGGISNRLDLDYIANKLPRNYFDVITRPSDPSLKFASEQFSDLLWSDPLYRINNQKLSARVASEYGCYSNTTRGVGFLFGRDVTDAFCKKYGFNGIIRSHEVRDEGISHDHPLLYTIFSASNYCQKKNKAAVIIIPIDSPMFSVKKFETKRVDDQSSQQEKNRIIAVFKSFLSQERGTLLAQFERQERNGSGVLRIDKWAEIISDLVYEKTGSMISPEHIITLKDYLCPCEDDAYAAKYKEMFPNEGRTEFNPQTLEILEVAFKMIDTNLSGTISQHEMIGAIGLINRTMNTNYDSKFILKMDTNQDGSVDFNEFKRAFLAAN